MRNIEFNDLASWAHRTSEDKGFWDKGDDRNFGEMIALVHSELTEALEEDRHNRPLVYGVCESCKKQVAWDFFIHGDKPHDVLVKVRKWYLRRTVKRWETCNGRIKPEGALVELADAHVRLADMMEFFTKKVAGNITPADIVTAKMLFNEGRPYKHGGIY